MAARGRGAGREVCLLSPPPRPRSPATLSRPRSRAPAAPESPRRSRRSRRRSASSSSCASVPCSSRRLGFCSRRCRHRRRHCCCCCCSGIVPPPLPPPHVFSASPALVLSRALRIQERRGGRRRACLGFGKREKDEERQERILTAAFFSGFLSLLLLSLFLPLKHFSITHSSSLSYELSLLAPLPSPYDGEAKSRMKKWK